MSVPTANHSKSIDTLPISPASSIAPGSVTRKEPDMHFLTEPERCAFRRRQLLSFCSAMLNCLCAGSLMLFSLWAPIFQDKLGFSQMQINGISIAGALGMYIPVPIFGAICDIYGPAKLSLLSAFIFGPSYLLAAHAFEKNMPSYVMLIAFVLIGSGTSSMYFAGVTTCAKNFTGNSRGIALALPIAAFGLSSLWEAQFVSRVYGGYGTGEIQVGKAFVFFASLLMAVGVIGSFGLVILPEPKFEDEEAREVAGERTSLLRGGNGSGYGTDELASPSEEEEEENQGWLNKETKAFLRDHTMWWFAMGVFLTTGPGESFINNMGTLIRSLYTPDTAAASLTSSVAQGGRIDTATHVSIIALTSTVARLVAGSLSDYLAPSVPVGPPPPSAAQLGYLGFWRRIWGGGKPVVSRMYLLIGFALVMCWAQLFVAFGGVDQKGERFWIVSSAMGSGYGAVFTLSPTIVSVVWGVQNFGTNWGIITVTPAIGATLYGIIFAVNYDNATKAQQHIAGMLGAYYHEVAESGENLLGVVVSNSPAPPTVCYGKECYESAFMIMGVSVGLACVCWVWAWRGKAGWASKGIVV